MSYPAIMLLGTVHFQQSNADAFNPTIEGILTEKRQQEIQACIEKLATYAPTKVLVETDNQALIDEQYQAYRQGQFTITANEIYQLGFQLAAKLHHDKVYAIDWQDPRGFDINSVLQFAYTHGQSELMAIAMTDMQAMIQETNLFFQQHTISELLRFLNAPTMLARSHRPYILMARVASEGAFPGSILTAQFYERNLNIYAHICRHLTQPNERGILIIGAGHVPMVRQIFVDGGGFTLISPILYI